MVIYINTYSTKVFDLILSFQTGTFRLEGNIWSILTIILASLPLVFTIANIMLANNLRDLERDIENHRYTLVFILGVPLDNCCSSYWCMLVIWSSWLDYWAMSTSGLSCWLFLHYQRSIVTCNNSNNPCPTPSVLAMPSKIWSCSTVVMLWVYFAVFCCLMFRDPLIFK